MKKRVLSLFLAITLCLSLTPTGALAAEGQPPEQTVSVTQEAETGAGENASPAKPEENPTENAPAAAEKNTADEETGKEPAAATGRDEPKADGSPSDDDAAKVQNQLVMAATAGPDEPTMMGQNDLLAPADEGQTPANAQNGEGGGIYVAPGSPTEGGGGTYIPGEDTRTEIWCTSKPDSIGRGYDGTTDGSTIPLSMTFTDGTDTFTLKEGTGFTATKTFDSADAGWHTVTVEITLTGETAKKYKLRAGEEKFEIGGNINKAYPKLNVSLSRTTCTVGEKILPLLSVEGAPKDAEVTYYYLASAYKSWAGSSDVEGSEAMPAIDENTAISEPGTYYVYAKTGKTKNYEEERSTTAELTVNEAVVEAASVTHADGTDGGTYESLPAALNAAQNGDTVKLLADHVTDADALNALGENFTFEQYACIVPVVTKTLTLDLNHKTVDYLEVGFTETNEETQKKETLATGNLTVTGEAAYGRISNLLFMAGALDIQSGEIGGILVDDNGVESPGGLFCDANSGSVTVSNGTVYGLTVFEGASVTVNGGSKHAGEWVVASGATLNITDGTFGEVQFTHNGTIAISGGTFKSIKSYIAEELQPLMSLLDTQKVHAFYKGDDVQDGNATELADVTVKEHTHTPDENGKCACGASCVASVTNDAQSTNYASLDDALNAAQNGDTVTLLSDVDLGETYVTINKSITFDLGGKTLSSSEAWLHYGVLLVKDATVTVKNGTVKAAGDGSCAIQAYRSGAIMTLEDVTATVTSGKSSVTVGDFGSAVIKSGDYQGLYVGKNSHVTLEGGTFRPYMDNITNKNVKSIFWKVNETTDDTSRDCMELLGDGCVYVDENGTQVRTGGGFNTVVTVQQGTAIDAPVAKIGDVEYASLSKAIDAVQNGGTITLLDDLDLGNGAVLQVGFSQKNFTIDLDNHTLSADGACLIMLHNGSQLTLKNGTLDGSRCMSYYGVLHISSNSGPKLTLENVTAKSGSVADSLNVQRSVPLVYVTNGTVVFDGGTYTGGVLLETDGNAVLKSGTFQKGTNDYSIKTEDSGKHLSDYLDESLFWNGNTVLDLSSETQTADEVTVRPCEHNWENGKCTVCQKVCDHGSADGKSMTEDPCHTCGMKAAAQVDITGSATKYFPSFTDALAYANQNSGCTLKLLADVTETTVMINKPFIFDLNGHNVDALSVDAKATIKDSGTEKGKIGKVTVSNNKVTDLTLGGLLEEGYAFKYETGYWADDSHKETISGLKVTVEKAPIQSVKIYAKDKNHKEVPTTMAYGTTGEVTLVSSCRMGETSGADLSYLWYKLEGAAATAPLEGATGANYTLPDNLTAGTHTYLLICTSGGYSKSAEITITVTPVSLAGAEVTVSNLTYNGNPQKPTVTVKLGDETLSRDNDYTVQVTKQTDAGSYKLTIKGGGNYSGEIKDVEWKIEPMKIDSVMVSSDISKVYDGTAEINMSANEWATALKFKTLSASDVVDVPSKTYTISDAYFVEKSGEETIHSPDAGVKYGINFKITLNDDNYVLQTYGEYTPSTSKVITQSGGATFTIKQATVTSPGEITQLVFNDLAKTYTIDLAKLLPKLSEGCKYGDIQYQGCDYHFTDSTYLDSNNGMSVSKEGILTLPTVSAHTSDVNTQIGTITVPVVTTNYQKFEFTIKVYISERISPNASGVTVSASDITYGQMLNESKLTATGTMKHPGTGEEVKGTFAWTNPEAKPGAAGDYTASWTFTPAAGYEEYAPATGTVTIKVNKATPTFTAPTAQENLTYTGQEQALITAGSVTDYSTMQYSLTENGTYSQDIPTGTDAGAYTVWYRVIGDANHNDTAPASVPVRIGKKPLTITGVTAAPKPYDGTTNADISSVTFDNVTLNRGTDYNVTASFDDAGVGNGKNVTATVTLMEQVAKNYALEQSNFPATGSITKAAAPDFTKETALTIVNGHEKTYTVTLPTLPTLETPKEYGALTYEISEIKLDGGYYTGGAKVENGKLTLPIQKNDVETTGSVGTVTVVIKSINYEDITLTVKVSTVNKIKPTPVGEITASEITYGDTLSKSKISGKMKDPNTGYEVNGTFAWTDGTIKPDANDNYEAEWTFTPDAPEYATVTGKVTVEVAPKSIEGATITLGKDEFTYNAAEQSPKITGVTLKGWSETITTYDIVSGDKATNANDSIPLTIKGIGNYTGTATAKWKIIPAELTVSVSSVEKVYDGTINATVTPTFNGLQGGESLTAADYSVTAAFEDAKVGYKKLVTGKVTLNQTDTAKNYLLKNDGTFSTGEGTIKKADAPTVQPVELTIYNDVQKDYFVDLPPLPELGEGKSYGTVNYNNPHAINLSEGYTAQSTLVADPENLKTYRLLLRMNQTGSLTEEIGTVTIPVTTSNYQDITLTVKVKAVNQIAPVPDDGTITATPITYGNELSASTITGTMQDPNTGYAVNGTFTWVTPAEKLKAGSHNAKWIFTPDESNGGKYTTNNGTATVTVNPKAVTVSGITANDKVYDGTTNAGLDYSAVTLGGVLENDTLTVTATGTMESADVGEKKVTISNLTLGGASAANYVLAGSGNQTETTATITAKEVTVTITPNGGTYGSVTAAAADLSDAVEGDNVPVTLTYTGNDYNSTTVPVNVGRYTVTASIANNNYTLTGNTTADFVITPKAVTVSGITANGKVYDGTTNATLDCSNAKFGGVLENDTLTVTAKGMFEKADVGKQKVTISDLTLGGNPANNYVLAKSGNQTETTATITAKEVTVTPDKKSKVYEEKDPELTYQVSGVLGSETLKGITLTRAEGENVGEYAITGTADAGANPNYEVKFADGKFTIDPKSIDGATVVLGKGLIANGAEQTQTVEKVLLDDKELPADSYTVAGNTATTPGSHTLTITAKGNYTGTVKQTYVIVPAKAEDAPDKEIAIGRGKVNVKFEGTVPPATQLTDKAELLAMLVDSGDITADELAQIAHGANVNIVLTVKEANVSAEIKTAMAQAAKDYTIGQYLDISLLKYMTVNGIQQADVALHTTKDALTISVAVPDALINTNSAVNRTYYIVRNHEGTIDVLDAAFDAAGKTLTFKTDRFSIYAIAYKDTAVPSSSSKPGSNNSSNDSETKKNEVAAPTPAPTPASTSKPSTITAMPQTGDTFNPTLYVVLLVASLLGLAVVFVCKKRNDK